MRFWNAQTSADSSKKGMTCRSLVDCCAMLGCSADYQAEGRSMAKLSVVIRQQEVSPPCRDSPFMAHNNFGGGFGMTSFSHFEALSA